GEVLIRLGPETELLGLQGAQCLVQCRDVVAAQAHDLTDGFHGGGQGVIGAGELLEGKAWGLDHHVVEGRLEGGRGDTGDVVGDLIQGVADGQLGGQLRDRETGGLGGQRGGTGHARVHLDGDDAAVGGVDGELDVTATGINTDLTDDGYALVTHDLVLTVGQRHGGGDGDGIAGVHTECIDVLDGADDHDIVVGVTHELQLEFLPTEDGFLNQDVGLRGGREATAGDAVEVLHGVRQAGTQATHGEGGAHDDGETEVLDGGVDLVHVVADGGAC